MTEELFIGKELSCDAFVDALMQSNGSILAPIVYDIPVDEWGCKPLAIGVYNTDSKYHPTQSQLLMHYIGIKGIGEYSKTHDRRFVALVNSNLYTRMPTHSETRTAFHQKIGEFGSEIAEYYMDADSSMSAPLMIGADGVLYYYPKHIRKDKYLFSTIVIPESDAASLRSLAKRIDDLATANYMQSSCEASRSFVRHKLGLTLFIAEKGLLHYCAPDVSNLSDNLNMHMNVFMDPKYKHIDLNDPTVLNNTLNNAFFLKNSATELSYFDELYRSRNGSIHLANMHGLFSSRNDLS